MHQDWHQVRLVAFTTRPPPRSPSGAPRIARSPLRFVMHASTTRRPRLHPPANAGSEHARRLASVGNLTLVHLDRTGPRPRGARRLPKCRVGQRAAGWAHGRTAGGSGRAEAGAPAARESPLTWSPYKPIVRRWTAPGHTARPGDGATGADVGGRVGGRDNSSVSAPARREHHSHRGPPPARRGAGARPPTPPGSRPEPRGRCGSGAHRRPPCDRSRGRRPGGSQPPGPAVSLATNATSSRSCFRVGRRQKSGRLAGRPVLRG